jgi:hypothetical protein
MPSRELVELMLGITGKSVERIQRLLLGGTLVSGASRLRWKGWEADRASIEALLDTFPGPEPDRPFAPERCLRAVMRGTGSPQIDLSREAASRKRLLRRSSFWDTLMQVVSGAELRYIEYSYRERADHYRAELSSEAASRLRAGAAMIRYSVLEAQIKAAALESVDLYVARQPI